MRLPVFVFVAIDLLSLLAGCTAIPAPDPASPAVTTVTLNLPPTAAHEVIGVDQCEQQATTQLDMNKCASKKRDEAVRELEDVVQQVQAKYNPDTRYAYLTEVSPQATVVPPDTFLQLQADWETWAKRECMFRYGRIISDTNILFYENGSSSPMFTASCETAKYKQRIEELRHLYLDKQ